MQAQDVKIAAVIGVGTMGPGIAQSFAQAGVEVKLFSRSPEGCRKGLLAIEQNLRAFGEHELIGQEEIPAVLSRVQAVDELAKACAGADFVVEAVSED